MMTDYAIPPPPRRSLPVGTGGQRLPIRRVFCVGSNYAAHATTVKQPETRYAKGPEGNIAYQLLGDGPMDLVVVPGGFSHLDMLWSEVHHHWNALRPPRTQRATNTVARSAVRRPGVGAVGAAATDLSATLAPWPRRLPPVLGLIGAGSVFGVVVVARLRTTILTSNALLSGSSACYALGL